jgi:hypothetical protein
MDSSTKEDPFALVYLQEVPVTLVAASASNNSPLATGILAISVEIDNAPASTSTDAHAPQDRRLRLDLVVNDTTKTHCPVFAAELSVAQITKDVKHVDFSNLPAAISQSSSPLVVTVKPSVTKNPLVLPTQVESFVKLLQSAIRNATDDSDSEFQYQIAFQQAAAAASTGMSESPAMSIRLTLKERLPSGMVRLLWAINLKAVPEVTKSTTGTTDAADSMFAFTLRLLQRQQDLVDQLSKSQETFALLERDRNGWKETATSLENTWEVEKTQLVRNFCDLYSAKQRAHDESSAATQQALRDEIATLKLETMAKSSSVAASKKRPKKAPPDVLQDVPDDVDRQTFDSETVALLAAGQPLPLKASSSAASNHHDPANTTSTTATGKGTLSGKRRNPLTGVTEYFDMESALADVLADGEASTTAAPPPLPPLKKTRVSRAAAASYQDEDSDLEAPAVAAEKTARSKRPKPAAGPKKATKTKKDTEKMQVDNDDDDDDDDQYVDKDLDAEIMADLLSLQKAPL